MYLVYEFQLAIFHAKYLIVGLWIVFYTIILWVRDITSGKLERPINYYLTLPLNLLFFIYSIFMIKGVSIITNFCLIKFYTPTPYILILFIDILGQRRETIYALYRIFWKFISKFILIL